MLKNKLTITAAAIALVMLATACTTKPNSSLHSFISPLGDENLVTTAHYVEG